MLPKRHDFVHFYERLLYNIGRRNTTPKYKRFSYVEKAEYWALVWGTVVMIATGLLLWFDNLAVKLLGTTVLEVIRVIHFYEAWLATLAIIVWHMYVVVFQPSVYPGNPAWITGKMPRDMYAHEHPADFEAMEPDAGGKKNGAPGVEPERIMAGDESR